MSRAVVPDIRAQQAPAVSIGLGLVFAVLRVTSFYDLQ